MARWGNCDYKQLQHLRDNIARLQSVDMDKFCRDVSKELARKLLRLVIPRTPVGMYKNGVYTCAMGFSHQGHSVPGKNGGTLRRGWTAKSHDEAAGGSGMGLNKAAAYADALPIVKSGNTYTVEIINPVEYASYVEFGHRTVNGGWARGHYFLTVSEQDLERLAPAAIERKLEKLLKDIFKV